MADAEPARRYGSSIDYRIHFRKRVFYIRLKTFSHEKQPDGNILLEGYIQNITDIQQRRNDINLLTHAINNSTEDIFAAHEDGSSSLPTAASGSITTSAWRTTSAN